MTHPMMGKKVIWEQHGQHVATGIVVDAREAEAVDPFSGRSIPGERLKLQLPGDQFIWTEPIPTLGDQS